MNLDSIFPNGLYIQDAYEMLLPVAIYVISMALYGMFIFRFYRFVASRDMFGMDLSRYEESRFRWVRRVLHVIMYIAKYLVVFPAFAFFWFAVLTLILAFLSKDRPITDVLLIALATVSAIRVSAYYNEDLSRDLAKILPFAVLAIFLIDASFFDVGDSFEVLREANDHRERILYYLLFLVGVEFVLRTLMGLVLFLFRRRCPLPRRLPTMRAIPRLRRMSRMETSPSCRTTSRPHSRDGSRPRSPAPPPRRLQSRVRLRELRRAVRRCPGSSPNRRQARTRLLRGRSLRRPPSSLETSERFPATSAYTISRTSARPHRSNNAAAAPNGTRRNERVMLSPPWYSTPSGVT